MPEFLIAFNDEWIPDETEEFFVEAGRRVRALRAEMEEAGVLVYTGGLDLEAPAFSVDVTGDGPTVMDGPYAETKEHLGGLCIVSVADADAALSWAEKVAACCGWPQEVRPFRSFPQS
jgi:hypothetical protein